MTSADDTAPPDRLLKTTEVATLFGVHRAIVTRWAQAGQIDAIRLPGGQLRFRVSVVLAPQDRLLKTTQVATLLGVTRHVVTHLTQAGQLDAIRTPGGRRRFRESDVLALRAQIAES